MLRHLRGRVIVLWDNGSNHQGPLIRALCARFSRLHLERLPAYAPELNPVEPLWSCLKHGMLANFVPRDVGHLHTVVEDHLGAIPKMVSLLKAIWQRSALPFPSPALLC